MRRLAVFGAVLTALGVLYLAAWATQSGASGGAGAGAGNAGAASAGQRVAVTSATRACPPPGPDTGEARIAVISMSSRTASGTGGATDLSAIPFVSASGSSGTTTTAPEGAAPSVTVKGAGQLTLAAAPAAGQLGGTAVAATGTMAEGFEAEEVTASGMGTVACTHPGADMWFVGTGQQAGAPDTRLYLMNAGDLTASVEVTMLTDAGVQQGLNSAITIAPHHYLWENIAQFTSGSVVLALHVQTSSGQVAAAVWQGSSGGSGGAWLPQAAAPSTQVVIPGLTAAGSAARLFVTVPGSVDAKIRVVALTSRGKFLPFGSSPVDAPAAASSSFALTSLGASAAALVLTSSVPITAGVAVPGSGVGAFTAASAPVTEQGVIAGNPVSTRMTVSLVLSAPAGAATAAISVVPSSGAAGRTSSSPRLVRVPAGHTVAVTVQPPSGTGQAFAIVVTPRPGSGPLYAARVVTSAGGGMSGSVLSLLPVASALTQLTLPPSRDSYSAVLP